MIIYDGIVYKNMGYFLCFRNEKLDRIEIPIDPNTIHIIEMYLQKFSPGPSTPVEPEEDETSPL